MRIDVLIRLAALTLGTSLSLASAQQPPAAAATMPTQMQAPASPATTAPKALPPGSTIVVPPAAAPSTAPGAEAFGEDWTGRPQSLADAQREARAAAAEALKECRRQSANTERCLEATRRDNQAALQRAASRGPAASRTPATSRTPAASREGAASRTSGRSTRPAR